jgi:hypothetical protein
MGSFVAKSSCPRSDQPGQVLYKMLKASLFSTPAYFSTLFLTASMTPPLVPPAQPGDTNFGLIPFSARRLELDWNIFAALDGSPQTSSPRPWKVLLLSNNISGSKYTINSKYLFNGLEITYNRYCIQLNKDYVDYLLLEDQAIYINFFNWMYRISWKKLL